MEAFLIVMIAVIVNSNVVIVESNVSVDLDISQTEAFVNPGSDLNITCTCTNCAAENIIWKYYLQTINDDVTVPDQSTSQLSWYNLQFADTGNYKCCIKEECSKTLLLYVGTPPGPISNLHCQSRNIVDYWCTWQEGNDTNLRMEYQFYFKQYTQEKWLPCPDSATKGDNSCYIPYQDDPHYGAKDMKVISSNAMGNHTDKTTFNPDKETVTFPPSDISALTVSHDSIRVNWNIPREWNNDIFPNELNYVVRYSASDSSDWKEKPTNEMSVAIADLKPYTEYNIEAKAKCRSCHTWSTWSDVVTTRTNESLPTGYVDISSDYQEVLKAPDKRDVTLFWTELPADQLNGKILFYQLSIKDLQVPGGNPKTYKAYTEQFTATDLNRFSRYNLTIEAHNSVGRGPSQPFCCIQDLTTVPSVPTDLQAKAVSNSSIRLEWSPPMEPNGYLQPYDIRWRVDSVDDYWLFNGTASSESTSYLLTYLKVYTLYDIQIRANNHMYEGQWKDTAQPHRTMEGAPSKPPEPVSVEKVLGSPEELTVSWTHLEEEDTNGVIRGFKIFYCLADSNDETCDGDVSMRDVQDGAVSSATLDRLTYFTTYFVWVAAYTIAGQGPPSGKYLATTAQGTPGVPRHISIDDITSTNISLTWSPPEEPKGIISHYLVTYINVNDNMESETMLEVYGLSVVILDLFGDSRYSFKVQACNTESQCGDITQINDKTKIGAPGPPILHSNTQPVSSTKMSLSWDPPLHPNGPIKYYVVEYRPTDSEAWTRSNKLTTTSANVTVDCAVGDEDVMFDFRVFAETQSEDGALLPGEPSPSRQYEMCSQLSDTELTLVIVLPFFAIITIVLSACFTYQYRKNTIPDPYIDVRIYTATWHITFRILEPEVFDDLQVSDPSSLMTHIQTAHGNNTTHLKIAGLEDDWSTSYESSTDSGCPRSPSSIAEDFSPIFLTPDIHNKNFNDTNYLLSGTDFAHAPENVTNHEPVIDLSRFDLFNAISPYLKIGGKKHYKKFDESETGSRIDISQDVHQNTAIPLSTISHTTDNSYSKLSNIPSVVITKQSSNAAHLSTLQQTHAQTVPNNTISTTTDPYSKLSNIPLHMLSKSATCLPPPQPTCLQTVPNNKMLPTTDTYSKLSNIPPQMLSKSVICRPTPQPLHLQTLPNNKMLPTTDSFSKRSNIPSSVLSNPTTRLPTSQPPHAQTLPSSSIVHTSDPYSQLSSIPINVLSNPNSSSPQTSIPIPQPTHAQTPRLKSHTSPTLDHTSKLPNALPKPPPNILPNSSLPQTSILTSQATHAQTLPSNTTISTDPYSKLSSIHTRSPLSLQTSISTPQQSTHAKTPPANSTISSSADLYCKLSNIPTNFLTKPSPTLQQSHEQVNPSNSSTYDSYSKVSEIAHGIHSPTMHVQTLPSKDSTITNASKVPNVAPVTNDASSKTNITSCSQSLPIPKAFIARSPLSDRPSNNATTITDQGGYSKVSEPVAHMMTLESNRNVNKAIKTASTDACLNDLDDYTSISDALLNSPPITSAKESRDVSNGTIDNDRNMTRISNVVSPGVCEGNGNGYTTMPEVMSKSTDLKSATAGQTDLSVNESERNQTRSNCASSSGIGVKRLHGYSAIPDVLSNSTHVTVSAKIDNSQNTNSTFASPTNPILSRNPSLNYSPKPTSPGIPVHAITDFHYSDADRSFYDYTSTPTSDCTPVRGKHMYSAESDRPPGCSTSAPTPASIPVPITNSNNSYASCTSDGSTSIAAPAYIPIPAITNSGYPKAEQSSYDSRSTPTQSHIPIPTSTNTSSHSLDSNKSSNTCTSTPTSSSVSVSLVTSSHPDPDQSPHGNVSKKTPPCLPINLPVTNNFHSSGAEQSLNPILPPIPIPVPAGLPPLRPSTQMVIPPRLIPGDISMNNNKVTEPSSEHHSHLPTSIPSSRVSLISTACTMQPGYIPFESSTNKPPELVSQHCSSTEESYSTLPIHVSSTMSPQVAPACTTQSAFESRGIPTSNTPVHTEPPSSTSTTSSVESYSHIPIPVPSNLSPPISSACTSQSIVTCSPGSILRNINSPNNNNNTLTESSSEKSSPLPTPVPSSLSPVVSSPYTPIPGSRQIGIPASENYIYTSVPIPVPSHLSPPIPSDINTQSTSVPCGISMNSTKSLPVSSIRTPISTSHSRESYSELPVPVPQGLSPLISSTRTTQSESTPCAISMNCTTALTVSSPCSNSPYTTGTTTIPVPLISAISPSRESYSDLPIPVPAGLTPLISSACTTQFSITSRSTPTDIHVNNAITGHPVSSISTSTSTSSSSYLDLPMPVPLALPCATQSKSTTPAPTPSLNTSAIHAGESTSPTLPDNIRTTIAANIDRSSTSTTISFDQSKYVAAFSTAGSCISPPVADLRYTSPYITTPSTELSMSTHSGRPVSFPTPNDIQTKCNSPYTLANAATSAPSHGDNGYTSL